MSQHFDAILKQMLDRDAADWIDRLASTLGLPEGVTVVPVDTDLSSVQLTADKVFRIVSPVEQLLHLEMQSYWDGKILSRLQAYNAILHHKHEVPVQTVIVLLRPKANVSDMTGEYRVCLPDGRVYQTFHYDIIRLWEMPAELFLTGGFGALPLALLTDDAAGHLEEFVRRIVNLLNDRGASGEMKQSVLASSYILLGLRYNEDEIKSAFRGVTSMEDSTTYQAILRKGRNEGLNQGLSQGLGQGLISILRERFGQVPAELVSRIEQSNDSNVLQRAIRQSVRITRPEELVLE